MTSPVISIITPTYRRESLLRHQHQTILQQSEQNFEWLILDDSPEPSAYFQGLSDPRIHYRHHAAGKMTIGAKRNQLIEQAQSEVIAHFDDDDYYGPDYLKTMLERLTRRGADIAKLSGWFVYTASQRKLGYWETAQTRGLHFRFSYLPVVAVGLSEEQSKAFETHYAGFGFTYVYRKKVWRETPFPDADFNEDWDFISAAMAKGCRLEHFSDVEGICLHILRLDNMSCCFPQFVFPDFMLDRLFPPEVKGFLT